MSPQKQKKGSKCRNKIFAIMSYIWVLCLVPFILNIEDDFVIKHAKQGLVLFIAELLLYILFVIPLLGWLLSPLGIALSVIISVLGMAKAASGQEWEIPFIGKYAKKINL